MAAKGKDRRRSKNAPGVSESFPTTIGKDATERERARLEEPLRSRPVRRPLDKAAKFREHALIDAGISKEDIARACREELGTTTTRQSVSRVFKGPDRSRDVIEPVAAKLLGMPQSKLWPE